LPRGTEKNHKNLSEVIQSLGQDFKFVGCGNESQHRNPWKINTWLQNAYFSTNISVLKYDYVHLKTKSKAI
jgi:hypothetical protein